MLPRGAIVIRQIEESLREELDLQLRYAAAIEDESKCARKFNAIELAERANHREMLSERMQAVKLRREELTRSMPNAGANSRLSALLTTHAHPDDAKRLLALIERLKILVAGNRTRGIEFGSVVSFALNLVSGSLSLLWSATQSVTTAYGRNKTVKESFVPKTKAHSTLEEA